MNNAKGPAGPDQKTADEGRRLAWLQAAASGPGKTLHLAVLLLAQCTGRAAEQRRIDAERARIEAEQKKRQQQEKARVSG